MYYEIQQNLFLHLTGSSWCSLTSDLSIGCLVNNFTFLPRNHNTEEATASLQYSPWDRRTPSLVSPLLPTPSPSHSPHICPCLPVVDHSPPWGPRAQSPTQTEGGGQEMGSKTPRRERETWVKGRGREERVRRDTTPAERCPSKNPDKTITP